MTSPVHRVAGLVRRQGWLQRRSRASALAAFPPPGCVLDFADNLAHGGKLTKLRQRALERLFVKESLRIAACDPVDLVCGYEVMAAPAGRRVADALGVAFMTRYQGTFLYPSLRTPAEMRLKYPAHALGTEVPADLVVMENDGTRGREVLMALGHAESRICFLVDGVNKSIRRVGLNKTDVLSRIGVRCQQDTPILLTLSKLNRWKRHDRIVGAMPAILARNPSVHLVIGHHGPMKQPLEALAKQLAVVENVHFVGALPHHQATDLLNICDVYVNTNDHSNLSNTVLEALQCGRPVVSLADGSLTGIVTDGVNGYLASFDRIEDTLPEAVHACLASPQHWAELSAGATKFADRCLIDWDARMDKEIVRMNELLHAREGSRSPMAVAR